MTTADVVGPDRAPPPPEEEQLPGGLAGPLPARRGSTCARATSARSRSSSARSSSSFIFGLTATNFFTAVNFVNLITQTAGTAMLAYGVVFVLLLGEIDLSIGYLAGIGALDRRGAPVARIERAH